MGAPSFDSRAPSGARFLCPGGFFRGCRPKHAPRVQSKETRHGPASCRTKRAPAFHERRESVRRQAIAGAHRRAQPLEPTLEPIRLSSGCMGDLLMKGMDPSKNQPASGEIRNDRKRGRMCSLRGRFAPFARLDRAKRLVAELACPVSRSATAHSTAFSVICGVGRVLPKDQPSSPSQRWRPSRSATRKSR